ncbi:hypothetical protein AAEX28_01435 [Lentisphaerota bacterium WC36G]|nr:hypothetical protein LJT99_04320 [Lentisphaerae bacterium WC36]
MEPQFTSWVLSLTKIYDFYSSSSLMSLIILLIAAIYLAIVEKRKKHLVLTQSSEVERINNLSGISSEEKKKIINALNLLPEVTEKSPLPDVHLRVASKLSKFYALYKIISFILIIAFLLILKVSSSTNKDITLTKSNFYQNSSYAVEILSAIIVVVLLLAICEYIAANKLFLGNLKARNFLIFTWLLNPFVIRLGVIANNKILLFALVVPVAFYVLWSLIIRVNANSYIAFDAKNSEKLTRFAVPFIAVILIFSSLFYAMPIAANFEMSKHSFMEKLGYSSGRNYEKINSVRLIVADKNNKKLKSLSEKLATKIFEKYNLDVVIHNEEEFAKNYVNIANELVLLIEEINYSSENESLQSSSIGNLNPKTGKFSNSLKKFKESFEKKFCIKIKKLFQHYPINRNIYSVSFSFQNHWDNIIKVDYTGSENSVLKALAERINVSLKVILEKDNSKTLITFPDYLCQKTDLAKSKNYFKELYPEAKIIATLFSPVYKKSVIYQLEVKDNIKQQVESIGKKLIDNNFNHSSYSSYSNNDVAILLISPEVEKGYKDNKTLIRHYGKKIIVIENYSRDKINLSKKIAPPEFINALNRYAEEYPNCYANIVFSNVKGVTPEKLKNIYLGALKQKNISTKELNYLYNKLTAKYYNLDIADKQDVLNQYNEAILQNLTNLIKNKNPKNYFINLNEYILKAYSDEIEPMLKQKIGKIIDKEVPKIYVKDFKPYKKSYHKELTKKIKLATRNFGDIRTGTHAWQIFVDDAARPVLVGLQCYQENGKKKVKISLFGNSMTRDYDPKKHILRSISFIKNNINASSWSYGCNMLNYNSMPFVDAGKYAIKAKYITLKNTYMFGKGRGIVVSPQPEKAKKFEKKYGDKVEFVLDIYHQPKE